MSGHDPVLKRPSVNSSGLIFCAVEYRSSFSRRFFHPRSLEPESSRSAIRPATWLVRTKSYCSGEAEDGRSSSRSIGVLVRENWVVSRISRD